MKAVIAWPVVALIMLGGGDVALAGDLKDEVKIEIESTAMLVAIVKVVTLRPCCSRCAYAFDFFKSSSPVGHSR